MYKKYLGKKICHWTVIGVDNCKKGYVLCRCDCGAERQVAVNNITSGRSTSCGCINREVQRNLHTTHNLYGCRLYNIWVGMKSRCYYDKHIDFKWYQSNGIIVCDEWKHSFESFYNWAISHGYSDELTLDRVDDSKGYEPDNCRFASPKEQASNRKTNLRYTINGDTKTLKQWAESSNIDYHHLYYLVKTKGMPIEAALHTTSNILDQFIQSYDLTDDDIEELIAPTMNEIKDVLRGDWRKTVLFLKGAGINKNNISRLENDYIKSIMIDERMLDDPFIQNNIYQLIKNRINEAKVGVLKVHGNYSIVCGDPFLLCQSIFGLEKTGLLKAGEIYNKYWVDCESERLACFRAPMTCSNNIRLVRPIGNENTQYWYKYMTSCTVFNSWDTASIALNGMDYDGDLVMLTDNSVLINKHEPLPALMCAQRRATKKISLEDDFIRSNIESFGNDIGQTTNWVTSMFEVRAAFPVGSKEYNILSYRIRCGQLYQQNL